MTFLKILIIMTPVTLWKLHLNPSLRLEPLPSPKEAANLNTASVSLPDGVYTTFRTFEGKQILEFAHHLSRLEESASLLQYKIHLDPALMREALRQVMEAVPSQEVRARVTVDLTHNIGEIYLSVEPLHLPSDQEYQQGVWVVTVPFRRQNPLAKQTGFIQAAESIRKGIPVGANDALMVDEQGYILEGLTSNFFGVRDGELWTAGGEVLSGITRAMLLELAQANSIPVRFEKVSVKDLPLLQEAFLTSSSRSILPIRQVDQLAIGEGQPGPLTRRLMQLYASDVHRRLS